MTDYVNSPPHYKYGKFEVIEILEEAVALAPDPVKGSLQYQVLKYLLRIWGKDNPLRDAQKSRWYLNRLIDKLEEDQTYVDIHTADNGDGQGRIVRIVIRFWRNCATRSPIPSLKSN